MRVNESFCFHPNIELFLFIFNPPCHGTGACSFILQAVKKFFLAAPSGMWDLSSLTRDQPHPVPRKQES